MIILRELESNRQTFQKLFSKVKLTHIKRYLYLHCQ